MIWGEGSYPEAREEGNSSKCPRMAVGYLAHWDMARWEEEKSGQV